MRSTFEFEVSGSSLDDIKNKAEMAIAKFLGLDAEAEIDNLVNAELHAVASDSKFTAKVYVRVK
jgi:hypothetical protein